MKSVAMVIVSSLAVAACGESSNGQIASHPSSEAREAVDYRSPEAARQVIQEFASLLERRRFSDAYDVVGPALDWWKEGEFVGEFSARKDLHVEVGPSGRPEGAAGSVYVSVPLSVSGRLQNGETVRDGFLVTLRRVNDVPGSTEAERHWHVEQFERKD